MIKNKLIRQFLMTVVMVIEWPVSFKGMAKVLLEEPHEHRGLDDELLMDRSREIFSSGEELGVM